MRTSRTLGAVAACLVLARPALADTNIWGIPGECQLQVVECSTERDDARRSAPRVLSSVFMQDSWTIHAYAPSPDGETLLILLEDGIRLVRGDRTDDYALPLNIGQREYVWHPDSKRVALWVREKQPANPKPGELEVERKAIAVLDVARLPAALAAGAKVPYEVVPWSSTRASPWSVQWSPDGQALLVLATEEDRELRETFGVITRVPVANREATRVHDLLRVGGELELLEAPPVGSRPAPDRLLTGTAKELFVLDERAERPLRLLDLPGAGLFNVEWSPDRRRDRVLLFYRKPVKDPAGRLLQGVYLLDLDDALGAPPKPPEQLYAKTDVHSVWFSPRGTYASWSGPRGLWYRAPDAKAADLVEVVIPTLPDGEDPLMKGFAWSADETKLAITAGNRLYIHELATRALYAVAEVGTMDDTFTAEPTWIGDRVVLSAYENAMKSGRVKPAAGLRGPARPPEDSTQGRGSRPPAPPRKP